MGGNAFLDPEFFAEMVAFYSESFGLPPLAAKIYVLLIVDFERKGLSFEDLVEKLHAGKSSVSENLKVLVAKNLISICSKERKRRFFLNSDYGKLRFMAILKKLKKEISIIDRLSQGANLDKGHKMYAFRELLQKNVDNIEDSLSKL